jgi:hypothetical protein
VKKNYVLVPGNGKGALFNFSTPSEGTKLDGKTCCMFNSELHERTKRWVTDPVTGKEYRYPHDMRTIIRKIRDSVAPATADATLPLSGPAIAVEEVLDEGRVDVEAFAPDDDDNDPVADADRAEVQQRLNLLMRHKNEATEKRQRKKERHRAKRRAREEQPSPPADAAASSPPLPSSTAVPSASRRKKQKDTPAPGPPPRLDSVPVLSEPAFAHYCNALVDKGRATITSVHWDPIGRNYLFDRSVAAALQQPYLDSATWSVPEARLFPADGFGFGTITEHAWTRGLEREMFLDPGYVAHTVAELVADVVPVTAQTLFMVAYARAVGTHIFGIAGCHFREAGVTDPLRDSPEARAVKATLARLLSHAEKLIDAVHARRAHPLVDELLG